MGYFYQAHPGLEEVYRESSRQPEEATLRERSSEFQQHQEGEQAGGSGEGTSRRGTTGGGERPERGPGFFSRTYSSTSSTTSRLIPQHPFYLCTRRKFWGQRPTTAIPGVVVTQCDPKSTRLPTSLSTRSQWLGIVTSTQAIRLFDRDSPEAGDVDVDGDVEIADGTGAIRSRTFTRSRPGTGTAPGGYSRSSFERYATNVSRRREEGGRSPSADDVFERDEDAAEGAVSAGAAAVYRAEPVRRGSGVSSSAGGYSSHAAGYGGAGLHGGKEEFGASERFGGGHFAYAPRDGGSYSKGWKGSVIHRCCSSRRCICIQTGSFTRLSNSSSSNLVLSPLHHPELSNENQNEQQHYFLSANGDPPMTPMTPDTGGMDEGVFMRQQQQHMFQPQYMGAPHPQYQHQGHPLQPVATPGASSTSPISEGGPAPYVLGRVRGDGGARYGGWGDEPAGALSASTSQESIPRGGGGPESDEESVETVDERERGDGVAALKPAAAAPTSFERGTGSPSPAPSPTTTTAPRSAFISGSPSPRGPSAATYVFGREHGGYGFGPPRRRTSSPGNAATPTSSSSTTPISIWNTRFTTWSTLVTALSTTYRLSTNSDEPCIPNRHLSLAAMEVVGVYRGTSFQQPMGMEQMAVMQQQQMQAQHQEQHPHRWMHHPAVKFEPSLLSPSLLQ
ncbi:hypothetical protein BKA70DRAFT_1428519 [Coprinopsis sp. MPI-PUGE-AT-0042]|nr:hypothetical protein BKA70DRAFT_1428519 [Coprinopsis sp. MPI-PUGE-AT-0042]